MFLTSLPSKASAISDFDAVIIKTGTVTLGGTDHTDTWFDDLRDYSSSHPSDTSLASAVNALQSAINSGTGWALFICPDVTCGGGGYGQVVITPPEEKYKFFYTNQGSKAFGVSASSYTLIHFRYATGGNLVDAGPGAAAVGMLTNSTDNQSYIGFQYYSNPSIMTRVVYLNSDIEYPIDYGGEVPSAMSRPSYVALGDSFSSGEGNPPFEYGTDMDDTNECHRSRQAYPRLLQAEASLSLGITGFMACSGATTSSVIDGGTGGEGNWGEGSQLNALSQDTEVVTITIGGNDIGFSGFARACVFSSCASSSSMYQEVWDIMTDPTRSDYLPSRLAALFSSITTRLWTNAGVKIYIVGYPYVITQESWADRGIGICPDFDEDEAAAAEIIVLKLNTVIETAVTNLNDSRFTYVDPLGAGSPFLGHELCRDGAYFNGTEAALPPNGKYAYVFHPNENGQLAYKELIADAMN